MNARNHPSASSLSERSGTGPAKQSRPVPARAPLAHFEVHGVSHSGLVRVHNEDSWFADASLGIAIVADGVGGHMDGALASRAAVECLAEYLRRASAALFRDSSSELSRPAALDGSLRVTQENIVARAIALANRRLLVVNAGTSDARHRRGSTIVGLWAPWGADSLATVFHVGDSRMYLLRNGQLRPLTRDHSAYQQWADSGKRGSPPPKSYILQALGLSDVAPGIVSISTRAGDRLLLCSDGLSNLVEDHELQTVLTTEMSLEAASERLVALALARGGTDNLTAVLCAFGATGDCSQ